MIRGVRTEEGKSRTTHVHFILSSLKEIMEMKTQMIMKRLLAVPDSYTPIQFSSSEMTAASYHFCSFWGGTPFMFVLELS